MTNELEVIIEDEISSLLISTNLPANNMGYTYLKYAVMLAYKNPGAIHKLTSELYPTIAEHFKTSAKRVERDIRYIITTTFDTQRLKNPTTNTIFDIRPKNGFFISLCETVIRKNIRSKHLIYSKAVKTIEANNKNNSLEKQLNFYKRLNGSDE